MMHIKNNLYCYLKELGTVKDKEVAIFIDNGAGFQAISTDLSNKLNLKVKKYPHTPLELTLGGGVKTTIPRKVTSFTLKIDGFQPFHTEAFVMEIPEQCDVLLGLPWFKEINPKVDWKNLKISPPDKTHQPLSFHYIHPSTEFNGYFYCKEYGYYHSKHGFTKLINSQKEFKRLLKQNDNQYWCLINTQQYNVNENDSEKTERQRTQNWDNLKENPMYDLLLKYKDTVFKDELPNVPPKRDGGIEAEVNLKDNTPVNRKQFRLSPEETKNLEEWTKQMLSLGLIRKSKSPYSAPTFVIKKPVGYRIVHDYRGINDKTIIPASNIPRKENIYDIMSGSKKFTAMDLTMGFFQVKMRERDVPYTAFSTPSGQYEYLVTPMGMAGSPSAFNRLVSHIFTDYNDFCCTYFDDLFVFTKSTSVEDHQNALRKVLDKCKEQQLYIKLAKCIFFKDEIPVLGDFFGVTGIRMDPDKVKTIRNWPLPKTKRDIQSFAGTVNYISKFCKNLAEDLCHLTELTHKLKRNDKVLWNDVAKTAFHNLKRKLSEPPILAHPDFDKPFHLSMDACNYSVGGYLFQLDENNNEKIIAYHGKKLSKTEIRYPIREKELLASLVGMRKWRVYLQDKPFHINTDHKTLETILKQSTCSPRLARWLNELSLYQPLFKYVEGKDQHVADMISRNPDWTTDEKHTISLADVINNLTKDNAKLDQDSSNPFYMDRNYNYYIYFNKLNKTNFSYYLLCQYRYNLTEKDRDKMFYSSNRTNLLSDIKKHYIDDPVIIAILRILRDDRTVHSEPESTNKEIFQNMILKPNERRDLQNLFNKFKVNLDHFTFQTDILYYKSISDHQLRIVVPNNMDLKHRILYEYHDTIQSGHPGRYRTYLSIMERFYWNNMLKDISKYIGSCERCLRNKATVGQKPHGLLNPLETPSNRWKDISMDFMTKLVKSTDGFNAIMVIVDRLTKRALFIPTHTNASAKTTAELFTKHYIKNHGIPETIISDRDSKFTSQFWTKLMNILGSKLCLSTAFRPQTDGQTEVTNKFINHYLRLFINPNHSNWTDLLHLAEFTYNSTHHTSIGMTPFVADLGYQPSSVRDRVLPKTKGQNPSEKIPFITRQLAILKMCQEAIVAAKNTSKVQYDKNRHSCKLKIGEQVLLDTSHLNFDHLLTGGKRKWAAKFIGPYTVISNPSPDTYQIKLPPKLKLHDKFHVSMLRKYNPDNARISAVSSVTLPDGDQGYLVKNIIGKRYYKGTLQYKVEWLGYSRAEATWEPITNLRMVQDLIDIYESTPNSMNSSVVVKNC